MKRRQWIIILLAGVLLGLAFFVFRFPASLWSQPSASAAAEIDEVRNLMLNSHTKWQTARGEFVITFYNEKGESQAFIDYFEMAQPNKGYATSQEVGTDAPQYTWISDGVLKYMIDHTREDLTEAHALPGFVTDLSDIPTSVDQISPDTIYPHPFAGQVTFPFREYLYSTDAAQGGGKYELLGEETVCGHRTWIVQYTIPDSYTYCLMWVDQATGVILKYQCFGGVAANKYQDMICNYFEVDVPVNLERMKAPWK